MHQLTYDFGLGSSNNGNVLGITHSLDPGRTQSFTYDQLNRIKTAEVPTAWGLSFGYDIWGNLLSQTVTKGSAPMLSVGATTNNRIVGFCYDAAGNLKHQGACPGTTYTYDAENRLTTTAGVTYTYDGDGKRVMKSNGTLYWHGPSGEVLMETDLAGHNPASGADATEYVYFNGQRIARRVSYAGVHYFFSDHLGSSRIVTDAAGNVVEDSDFYPFGGERVVLDNLNNNYKFTGQERDAESGLDFFIARHYAFSLGRFLQPDPLLGSLTNPQSLNRYAYALNNPLSFTDPTGLSPGPGGDETSNPQGCGYQVRIGSGCPPKPTQQNIADMSPGEFLVEELAGFWDTTGGAGVALVESVASGQAFVNIAETAQLAVTDPGAIVVAGQELVDQTGNMLDAAASGNPRAIGQVAGIVTTALAPTAKTITPQTTVYRVYGGASPPFGQYWTTANPARMTRSYFKTLF